MSEMDTVCKQRFDNKLSLMIENTQNNPWKEVWKSTKDENVANENCLSDNGKSNDTDMLNSRHIVGTPENIATSSSNGNEEAEVIETTESTSEISLEGKVAIAEVSSDYPSNAIEIDEDPNEDEACTVDVANENEDADDPVLITNDESINPLLNCQSQNENSVKVCEISSCSYFGKPDPLISIEKVDHDSSFESLCEKGSLTKQDGQSDIVLESDNNMHDDDDEDDEVIEAPHNTSDIEVEYEKSVHFEHNSTSSRYVHGIKDGRYKSHCKKSESTCDVVQISSSDEEEEDDDDDDMEEDNGDDEESVHSLFKHSKEVPAKKGSPTGDHVSSMITMDVLELNISAMKGGPISCFPSHSCIFFKDLSNHVAQEVSREVMVLAQSLESHQWVPMFGGLVLEITLNLTGCHDALMTFFQVPPLKIARCYLRFPPVLLRIYFEARLVGLSLKHNFHQFLNSNLFVRSATWQDCEDKSHQMSSFSLPDVRQEMVCRPRSTRKLRRSAHPYSLKILRSCRTPSKFSYYRPPKWPYLKKVEHYEKKRNEYFKENKGDYGTSGYQTAVTCSSQWSVAPHASQSFYQAQHSYYSQPYLAGHDFITSSSMGLSTFPMTHLQHSANMGIVSTSHHHHHLQSGQWFDRVRSEQQSPVYLTSGFQGTITKLFTYKPPNSKGGINVTNEDLFCLNDGEYLNDVIIDFYLKYLMEEIVSSEDKQRTHVFSSFFYGHLMSGNAQDVSTNLSPEEQRHAKVKTWTRHVDIFSKDFIIVPINESYHWFLAIICFPNVRGVTKYRSCMESKQDQTMPDSTHDRSESEATTCQQELKTGEPTTLDVRSDSFQASADSSSTEPSADGILKKEGVLEECMDTLPDQSHVESPAACSADVQASSESKPMPDERVSSESMSHSQESMGSEAAVCEVPINEEAMKDDEGNDDGIEDDILMEINSECDEDDDASSPIPNQSKVDETVNKPSLELKAEDVTDKGEEKQDVHVEEECNPRNPCILIFDSLKGESRYDVANILRQYLQVEWDQKKCATDGERSFDKSTMKGSMVTCPQQPNSSDCGIYVLQFVESFFLNPIKDFTLPLSLADWFTSKVAMSKRFQLAKLIMKLKDELNPSLDYDPNSDGCFNIDPILSDDDDDDDDDNEEEQSKTEDREDAGEKKDEKSESEKNEVDENNVHDDNKDLPCERHPEDPPAVCSAMSTALDSNGQEAEVLSTDEQNK